MMVVGGFNDVVNVLVVVFIFMHWDNSGGPAKIVVYGCDVGIYCGVNISVSFILGGENDEEIRVFFDDDGVVGCCFLGVCGKERELTNKKKCHECENDPAKCVCHLSFHHTSIVILFHRSYLKLYMIYCYNDYI